MSRVTDRTTKSGIILQQLRLCIARVILDQAAVSIIYVLEQSATPRHRQCSGERAKTLSVCVARALGPTFRRICRSFRTNTFILLLQQLILQPLLITPISSQLHFKMAAQQDKSFMGMPVRRPFRVLASCPVSAHIEPAIDKQPSQFHPSHLPSGVTMQ
jgi:hypothetical protein